MSYAEDAAMREGLRRPFPPEQIGQVDKGFGEVDFVGHAAVTDRLNQAAPDWTYQVEPVVVTGSDNLPHVLAVFGSMTVGGVTRWEVGDVERMSRYGDELKKGISDFISRAAMRFGVALDLWSKEDLWASASEPSRQLAYGEGVSGSKVSDAEDVPTETVAPEGSAAPGEETSSQAGSHAPSPGRRARRWQRDREHCDHRKPGSQEWAPRVQHDGQPVCGLCGTPAVKYLEAA